MSGKIDIVKTLYKLGAIKFGEFTLKSGIKSPVYIDLRCTISSPSLMEQLSGMLLNLLSNDERKNIKCICGVPYTALPFATIISLKSDIGMVMRRKEKKEYGTKQQVEGIFEFGDSCMLVEDVVTSGSSVLETAKDITDAGLKVTHTVLILDREQGGIKKLRDAGLTVHCLFTLSEVTQILANEGLISSQNCRLITTFIQENQFPASIVPLTTRKYLTYEERIELTECKILSKLMKIVIDKQSNVIVSADLANMDEICKLVDDVGQFVCGVKTHFDIMEKFGPSDGERLRVLAKKHNILIIEDRKFADIGSIASMQYKSGIVSLSDMVTVHGLPGPGLIQALKQVAGENVVESKGCLLIAEMSSSGQLADAQYSRACENMASSYKDFVAGFISQLYYPNDPSFIVITPGVSLSANGDSLGQQYRTPAQCISSGSDLVIVGRGIYNAENRREMAQRYQLESWNAYLQRCNHPTME